MKKFAVTGGLSSGKSTVCAFFEEHGALLLDADAIVHRLYSTSLDCKQKVVDLLGQTILTDNQLDRKKIANLAFSDPHILTKLEEIVHPLVREEISRALTDAEKQGNIPCAVVEIPLLFEGGLDTGFDATICVVTDEAIAKKRYTATGRLEEDYGRRMSRQLPLEQKAKRADYIIVNNGDTQELRTKVETLITKLVGS